MLSVDGEETSDMLHPTTTSTKSFQFRCQLGQCLQCVRCYYVWVSILKKKCRERERERHIFVKNWAIWGIDGNVTIENKQKISSRLLVRIQQSWRSARVLLLSLVRLLASFRAIHVIYCNQNVKATKIWLKKRRSRSKKSREIKKRWWYSRHRAEICLNDRILLCVSKYISNCICVCVCVMRKFTQNACQFIICQVHFIRNDLLWSTIQHLKWLLNRSHISFSLAVSILWEKDRCKTKIEWESEWTQTKRRWRWWRKNGWKIGNDNKKSDWFYFRSCFFSYSMFNRRIHFGWAVATAASNQTGRQAGRQQANYRTNKRTRADLYNIGKGEQPYFDERKLKKGKI